MLQRLKHLLSAALMAVLLVITVSPMVPTAWAAYTDDAGDWYSPMIQKAQEYKLMNGYPDGSFGVGLDITRAEFTTVLCQMFGWEPVEEPEEVVFDDVRGWAQKYIYAALEHGAVDSDATFRPQAPISREEMGETAAVSVTNDSRQVREGSIFVCVRGGRFDGHDKAAEALENGAAAVVVERDLGLARQIQVENARAAYALLCRNHFGRPGENLRPYGRDARIRR